MDLLGVHHLAVRVLDLERVGAFYREVLGLTELARHKFPDGRDRSIWFALPGGAFLALELADRSAPAQQRESGRLLCLGAADLARTAIANCRRAAPPRRCDCPPNSVDDLHRGSRGKSHRAQPSPGGGRGALDPVAIYCSVAWILNDIRSLGLTLKPCCHLAVPTVARMRCLPSYTEISPTGAVPTGLPST